MTSLFLLVGVIVESDQGIPFCGIIGALLAEKIDGGFIHSRSVLLDILVAADDIRSGISQANSFEVVG